MNESRTYYAEPTEAVLLTHYYQGLAALSGCTYGSKTHFLYFLCFRSHAVVRLLLFFFLLRASSAFFSHPT